MLSFVSYTYAKDLPPYLITEMPLPTCDYERLMREAGERLLAKSAESASAAGFVGNMLRSIPLRGEPAM